MSFKKSILIFVLQVLLAKLAFAVQEGETFGAWKGACENLNNNKLCAVTQTVFDSKKKPVVRMFIRKVKTNKGDQPLFFTQVPLGVSLRSGLNVAVDNKELLKVPFDVCDPAGCNAVFALTPAMQARVRKGSKMQIGLVLGAKTPAVYDISLSGVTKAINSL